MKLNAINGAAGAIAQDPAMKNLVLAAMVQQAPLINLLEFYTFTGNADLITPKTVGNTGGAFRALGTPFTPAAITPGSDVTVGLKIWGKNITTDKAYDARGLMGGVDAFHTDAVLEYAEVLGRDLVDNIFNSDGSSNSYEGLKAQIAAGQIESFNDALSADGSAAAKKAFFAFKRLLDQTILKVKGGCSAIVMPAALIALMESVLMEFVRVDKIQNLVGEDQTIRTYKNIPLLSPGYKADGVTDILTNDETTGGAASCSVYLLKFGQRKDVTIGTTPAGLYVSSSRNLNPISTDIEFQHELKIVDAKAAFRIKDIIIEEA